MAEADIKKYGEQLLALTRKFDVACVLMSNGFEDSLGEYEIMAGFGANRLITNADDLDTTALKFGFISYDYKNRVEQLLSNNLSRNEIPELCFFEPEYFFTLDRHGRIETNLSLTNQSVQLTEFKAPESIAWHETDKLDYLRNIALIKEDIRNGDYYELNYCTEWYAVLPEKLEPAGLFSALTASSPAPQSAYFKWYNKYLLCSSPERFLKKTGNKLSSQPIKGTRPRGSNAVEDLEIKNDLLNSEKDRAENIMITDLVRNDLSRICKPGSVKVKELCGIHGFAYVYQMISTIEGELPDGIRFADILKATFPMGSMTGAPKVKVMQRIEELETFKRGWYSGSVGYMVNGDFDLNVVIRSVQYNADDKIISYHTGGAITFDSDPLNEYAECETKAAAMRKVLNS